ncbi:MAG: RDD family protein, partial [Actinomycetota bacterium]
IALAIQQLVRGGHVFGFGFPPGLMIASGQPLLWNIGAPLVLLWSWVGLALIEGLSKGRTPGKALFRLRAASDDGTTISVGQAFTRRWSVVLGILAWIDWAAMFFTARNRRLLDLMARTMVVSDPERAESRVHSPVER